MQKNTIKGLLLFLILSLLIGCAASRYDMGAQSLENQDYDAAIEDFDTVLKRFPDDQRANREMGIAFFQKGELDTSMKHLLKAFIADSTDGRTLFYLGLLFEKRNEPKYAVDIYKRYSHVSRLSKIRGQIQARLSRLINEQMAADTRVALADESTLDVNSIPDNTIAVLYFKNMGNKAGLNPLQKGIADMLITDLSKVRKLQVVERVRLQKMMEEMGLGMTGLVDAATVPRVGKLLGAATLVNGTYLDLTDYGLRLDAGIVNTRTAVVESQKVEGNIVRIFQLEKDLVFRIVDQLGIQLSLEERDEIEIIPTENLLAFMAYCRGMDYEDRGMPRQAANEYAKAVDLDPNFTQAGRNKEKTEAQVSGELGLGELEVVYTETTNSTGQETAASRAVAVSVTDGTLTTSEEAAPVSSTASIPAADAAAVTAAAVDVIPVIPISLTTQLVRTGSILNQAFLPGIDSRKPAQEQSTSSFGNSAIFFISVPVPEFVR